MTLRTDRLRHALGSLLLAVVAIGGTLLLVEIGLLLTGRYEPQPPHFPGDHPVVPNGHTDTLIGWRPPENLRGFRVNSNGDSIEVRTNRDGFRGPDLPPDSLSFDVAYVGDSFTFGSGVDFREILSSLIADALPVRSFNFGVSGFGIDQMWLTARHYALPRSPDLLVVAFIADDLNRSLTAYRYRGGAGWIEKPTFTVEDGELRRLTPGMRPGPLWRTIERRSRLYQAWRTTQRRHNVDRPMGYAWKLNRALFEAMRDDARAAGVPLLAVYVPVRGLFHPAAGLAREFAELEIPFLDLASALPTNPESLFFTKDPHMNTVGHRFVADEVIRFLMAAPSMGVPGTY